MSTGTRANNAQRSTVRKTVGAGSVKAAGRGRKGKASRGSSVMPTCPECGGELTIDPRCKIEEPYCDRFIIIGRPLPRRVRFAPAALCNRCEFAIEIER